MINILVTGSNGQLGNELRKLKADHPDFNFIFTDIAELDITNPGAIESFIKAENISVIINCAAYTAVDKAESDTAAAYRINAEAPGHLAAAAFKFNALLVHISTDYVFSGEGFRPYAENNPCNPKSIYGKSKLNGELGVIASGCKYIIIRTAWLYSAFGHNFIKTVRKYGRERGHLNMIYDQIGTPTHAADLASAILAIIPQCHDRQSDIYHFTDEGVCSWYDFALEILSQSGINCTVSPISTEEYPSPAARPFYSVLNKAKIKRDFNITIPHWKESLSRCLKELEQIESIDI
ncbi:MAG: dTDP-4-dehydrorhamnose reductase [Bacteroidota bacterium]|nr:dTDP-4-dehydrorhamnose reductase [Bacteroidota bacterium]